MELTNHTKSLTVRAVPNLSLSSGLFAGFLDLICPPTCLVCGGIIESIADKKDSLCSACRRKIVTPEGQYCRRCGGRRVSSNNADTDECSRCRTAKFRFKRAIALGEYEADLRLLALRMKSDRTGILATSIARVFVNSRRTDLESVGADYIVPVPMHHLRRKDRGVNSPDLFAEKIGLLLKIPVAKHCVRRIRSTDLQYMLSHRMRAENVANAFAFSSSLFNRFVGMNRFADKTVLLVDDILTSGSTCNEIAKVLLSAGVRSVSVAVLARAEGGHRRTIASASG